MRTLVAFALLCTIAVHGQTGVQPPQSPLQPQPFPGGGTPSFPGGTQQFPGVGQPFPGGTYTGLPYVPPQFPGQGTQARNLYVIENNLGRRCISGVAEYNAIIQGSIDYDYTRDLIECPPADTNQNTFVEKTVKLYIISVARAPTAQCTFDKAVFLQMINGTPFPPGATSGKLFPCDLQGNPITSPYAGAANPYANVGYPYNPYNPYRVSAFGARYPGYGGVFGVRRPYGVGGAGASVGVGFPGRTPYAISK